MSDPNLPLPQDAVRKLAPFLDEIVFVGGVTLGPLTVGLRVFVCENLAFHGEYTLGTMFRNVI